MDKLSWPKKIVAINFIGGEVFLFSVWGGESIIDS